MPENIKKGITSADKQFGDYLKVNKLAPNYDFGAGYYFTEPYQKRGHDLINKNKHMQNNANERSMLDQTEDAKTNETQMNTLLNSTKLSNTNAKTLDITTISATNEPVLGGLGQTQIEPEQMDEAELARAAMVAATLSASPNY